MGKIDIKGKINILPKLALTRPVTVVMTLTALLVLGFISYRSIPVELMPAGFNPPFLGIWTPYPNANPEEVEQVIARPLEEVVRTIKGLKTVETNSFSDGCWTFLRFKEDADMDLAYAQLRDRIDRVKPDLPDDIERLYIRKWSSDDEPVMYLVMIPQEPIEDTYYFTEQAIKKPLEKIDGVANVEINGADEKSIQILIKQDAVKGFKINLYDIISQLRNDNFALSSGHIEDGDHKIFVRSVGKFKTLEQVRNIPIKGMNIRLKDIAEIVYDVPKYDWRQRINGKSAIEIAIYKESLANTVAVTDQIKDLMENGLAADPRMANVETQILFNQGRFIKESNDNLMKAGMWGGFFAFIVLFFFLRRTRMTIMLIFAIPLSIMVSMIVLYFMGWTLNLITMMGLMISIGMVVDNSIVVLENIYRHRKDGLSILQAAAKGSTEVGQAVVMATLTTIVVFLPLILMSSDGGFKFYMLRIGIPVVISLVASLGVAMVLIPLASTRVASSSEVVEPKIITFLSQYYGRLLETILKRPIEVFIILIMVFFVGQMASNNLKETDNMDGNINDFRLIFDLPDNYTIEDAERVVKMVEDTIGTKKEIYKVKTIDSGFRNNRARVRVFLEAEPPIAWYDVIVNAGKSILGLTDTTQMDRDAVLAEVKERIPKLPGVTMRTSWRQNAGGSDASVTVNLYGDDTRRLAEISKEVERRLKAIPEILSVETELEKGNDEIQLVVKREQAQNYGVDPQTISGTVMYALRGIQLPKFQTDDREIDMLVQLQERDRETLEQLKNITFFTHNGKEIPLEAVATIIVKKGFGRIYRENGKTFLSVKANTTDDDMGKLHGKIDKAMAGIKLPYGYSWGKGSRFRSFSEGNATQMFAVILSIAFVFLIMAFLFESFVMPVSVIIAIPFAFTGAWALLYLTGTPSDMMSKIGLIILIGVVVNNAIVLIDLINQLRKQGFRRYDAIVSAGKQRLRPILMTAFTTIGGLIPMALGNAKMIGISYKPLGITIIGGMMFSTFVALLAVPWAYQIMDDLSQYIKKLTSKILAKKKAKANEEAETIHA